MIIFKCDDMDSFAQAINDYPGGPAVWVRVDKGAGLCWFTYHAGLLVELLFRRGNTHESTWEAEIAHFTRFLNDRGTKVLRGTVAVVETIPR